jgi:SAM-dependent methyltransferase
MKSVEESVVTAIDGTEIELFPFIPYILQDSWEIGADPEVIIRLIVKHKENIANLKVLDLGCGKGAVTVKIAHKLNCLCYGIDALADFIDYAKRKQLNIMLIISAGLKSATSGKGLQNYPHLTLLSLEQSALYLVTTSQL